MSNLKRESAVSALLAARRIADYATTSGTLAREQWARPTWDHLGAVAADAVLQAGLNYSTVVRPRVLAILTRFPETTSVSSLVGVVRSGGTAVFLNWEHAVKVRRFNELVLFWESVGIETVSDLRCCFADAGFRESLGKVHGIGPKTVDYMACLVGIDSFAVDRHVRAFAKRAGVEDEDYDFLHHVFCCAADLLSVRRRDFDALVWQQESMAQAPQLTLSF